jgi:non-specific serine/threonine protein kinase
MAAVFATLAAVVALSVSGATTWQPATAMPTARTEVASAPFGGGIAVVGGLVPGCTPTSAAELYLPTGNRWRPLPALPAAVHHAAAASSAGKLYVVGGYGESGLSRLAFVYDGVRWRRLPAMPQGRGAGGAAIVGGKLYVVGGVAPDGLAFQALVLDLTTRAWSTARGPTPREHLAVAASGGRIFALAGRLGGANSNLATFEAYSPATGRWARLRPVPVARGGTGLAAVRRDLVSVGGETSSQTIRSVYAYNLDTGTWRRLSNLRTPRHGLAVEGIGRKVYAVGGGPTPGCSFSGVNEYLELGAG